MRLAVAEARRFPDLAAKVSRTARDLSTDLGPVAASLLNWTNSARCPPSPRSASQRRRGSSLISLLCPCCFGRCSR